MLMPIHLICYLNNKFQIHGHHPQRFSCFVRCNRLAKCSQFSKFLILKIFECTVRLYMCVQTIFFISKIVCHLHGYVQGRKLFFSTILPATIQTFYWLVHEASRNRNSSICSTVRNSCFSKPKKHYECRSYGGGAYISGRFQQVRKFGPRCCQGRRS